MGSSVSASSSSGFSSSIGRKLIMAVSGLLLTLFVITHLLGNLQIFLGRQQFNDYANLLHSLPEVLWPARIVLLLCVAYHIGIAFSLWRSNRAARPERYLIERRLQASAGSLLMFQSGIIILFFILLHLLHFTFGALQPEFAHLHDETGREDVYSMVVHGFRSTTYSSLYIFCMLMIGLHLSHALGSLFVSFGFGRPDLRKKAAAAGRFAAAAVVLGYISIPLAVQLGLLRLP